MTSALVVAEGHGWFLRRYDQAKALQFLSFIDELSTLEVVATAADDLRAAVRHLRRFRDQRLTLVDAVGLQMMEVSSIKHCWSTDQHLGLTGVPLAIHSIAP